MCVFDRKDCYSVSTLHVSNLQGDHLSGKPGDGREFDSCQGNVRDFTKNRGNVKELFIINCIFVSVQVFGASTCMT